MIQEQWAENGDVRLHYLDSGEGSDPALTPVVFVPGMLGTAEDYRTEIESLAPRRAIALSLRGRGQSEPSDEGYRFVDHIRDIEAVIDASGVEDFCLMGYSIGVPYALGYTILNSSRVAGMILGDYPARYPTLEPGWIKQMAGRAPRPVLEALQRDSGELLLWADLPVINVPVLLLRGDQPGSLLSADDVTEYLVHLSQAMALVFPGSSHELWEPDRDRYLGTIRAFLEGLDAQVREDES